jgi:predicted transcriptional regulator
MILSAGDIALGSSLVVREADSVGQALRVMANRRARVVAVVDDSGTPRGVLRDVDLLSRLAGHSE